MPAKSFWVLILAINTWIWQGKDLIWVSSLLKWDLKKHHTYLPEEKFYELINLGTVFYWVPLWHDLIIRVIWFYKTMMEVFSNGYTVKCQVLTNTSVNFISSRWIIYVWHLYRSRINGQINLVFKSLLNCFNNKKIRVSNADKK